MTDDILAVLITIAILSAAFLWVPTLELCGPRCQKFFLARRTRRENAEPCLSSPSKKSQSPHYSPVASKQFCPVSWQHQAQQNQDFAATREANKELSRQVQT